MRVKIKKQRIKPFLFLLVAVFSTSLVQAQEIYSQAYGSAKDHPVFFLHGGPGYNSANFELTTAREMARNGFFVIVYDRRGEGRSTANTAAYTFEQTNQDLLNLFQKYDIKEATLIGHSFGGIVATRFAENYPQRVKSIVLVGAPLALQESFKTIITSSKAIYQAKNDSVNLKYIKMLEKMDTASLQYSSYSFMHAMQNGFYTPETINEKAKELYSALKSDTVMGQYATLMTYQAPQGFWKNESYTTLNLKDNLRKLKTGYISIYGLYGKDDGLYSASQIDELKSMLGEDNVRYFENCSHSVFIDQQAEFITALNDWLN